MRCGGGTALVLIAGFAGGGPAWAGAWPMEEGRVQAISSVSYDTAERGFDDAGDSALDADFDKLESSTFIEWGATERLTLFAQPVVQRVSMRQAPGAPVEEATGFASSQVGARYLLGEAAGGVLSVQGALVTQGDVENVINAGLGEGGGAGDLKLLIGRGWGGERRGLWLDGQAGYRWRFDEYPEEARFDATVGVRASPGWTLMAQSFSVWREAETSLALPESRSHKAQLSVVRRINDIWSVQVGGYGAYAGKNVVEERAGFAALWMRFNP
jgi:hypothetical protein